MIANIFFSSSKVLPIQYHPVFILNAGKDTIATPRSESFFTQTRVKVCSWSLFLNALISRYSLAAVKFRAADKCCWPSVRSSKAGNGLFDLFLLPRKSRL
ncbi:hypothetical protein NPIL_648681 [Nephila pilipes]|uniref:Uncharacterized protein n=1 Tax=Nephila pilipes TaxID=299642 RepID=A0A8X6QCC2_NEPPI|nr:hypothetical protein NPIL_648681 [Nephila pilipes]